MPRSGLLPIQIEHANEMGHVGDLQSDEFRSAGQDLIPKRKHLSYACCLVSGRRIQSIAEADFACHTFCSAASIYLSSVWEDFHPPAFMMAMPS